MSRVKRTKVLTETLHLERRVRCSVSTSQTATEMSLSLGTNCFHILVLTHHQMNVGSTSEIHLPRQKKQKNKKNKLPILHQFSYIITQRSER